MTCVLDSDTSPATKQQLKCEAAGCYDVNKVIRYQKLLSGQRTLKIPRTNIISGAFQLCVSHVQCTRSMPPLIHVLQLACCDLAQQVSIHVIYQHCNINYSVPTRHFIIRRVTVNMLTHIHNSDYSTIRQLATKISCGESLESCPDANQPSSVCFINQVDTVIHLGLR